MFELSTDTEYHLFIFFTKCCGKPVSLPSIKIDNKRQILRNLVNPEIGKHILDIAMNKSMLIQGGLFEEL